MQIHYLDGSRLRRSLLAACDYAQRQRDELNRINVFPVPDGDTGTNLTLTVRAIVDTMEPSRATRRLPRSHEGQRTQLLWVPEVTVG